MYGYNLQLKDRTPIQGKCFPVSHSMAIRPCRSEHGFSHNCPRGVFHFNLKPKGCYQIIVFFSAHRYPLFFSIGFQ